MGLIICFWITTILLILLFIFAYVGYIVTKNNGWFMRAVISGILSGFLLAFVIHISILQRQGILF